MMLLSFTGKDWNPMRRTFLVCLVLNGLWGCSSVGLEVRAQRGSNGVIRYEGPLAGPHKTYAQMAETLCKHMTARRDANTGTAPLGYCAGNFHSPEDNTFFISQIVEMTGSPEEGARSCALSRELLNPENTKEVVFLGGARQVPGNARSGWHPTHFLNQKTMQPHDRDLLVFSLDGAGACTVYDYEHFSRVVTTLHGDKFMAVGKVRHDGEAVQAFSAVR
jgi:hypothetical protein